MTNGDPVCDTERAPIADAPISLILTAHNAGSDLREVVEAWLGVLASPPRLFEIILVDDGSRDDSSSGADLLALEQSALRVFRHSEIRGPGAALATGLIEARHPLVCHAPCDRQYLPADLSRLLAVINEVDLATGYRVARPLPLWMRAWDRLRMWMTRVLLGDFPPPRNAWLGWKGFGRRLLARWVFGLRVLDPECSFRLYRREVFRRIPIQCHGPMASIEVLAKANHLGCLIAEAPVSWSAPTIAEPDQSTFRREFFDLFRRPDFGPPRLDESTLSVSMGRPPEAPAL